MDLLDVVILAAGKGTRMHSTKPKVLHQLAGKTLLQHVVDSSLKLDPESISIVYGYGGGDVLDAMKNYDVNFAMQEPQLGTGHAVLQAISYLNNSGRTLILYGDVPLIQYRTLHLMQQVNAEFTLLTVNLSNPTGYGRIIRNCDGDVISIVEDKDALPEQREISEVNTGIMLVSTSLLSNWLAKLRNDNSQSEYYLTDIVAMAVQQGITIHTVQPENVWEIHGVNSKEQLALLERTWQVIQSKNLLTQGVTLYDPDRIDVRGSLECDDDVVIDIGCIFEGKVVLGRNVKIGAYCVIKNATIADNTQIYPYSHIEENVIGQSCIIGPYARLRPGTKLHDYVHVGNFVEIKNSEISDSSKANHLSYIGDSSIGSRVNIGAGTITCNYDGANKYRTIIEDDVFVGSDTQLVAPVRILKGSTIGAGSTITRDTPANELTLSRSKQISISGWKRPVKQHK